MASAFSFFVPHPGGKFQSQSAFLLYQCDGKMRTWTKAYKIHGNIDC